MRTSYIKIARRIGAFQLKDYSFDVNALAEKVAGFKFADHYSNYNDGGWSALSQRLLI